MTAPEPVVVRALGVAVGIPAADDATADRLRHQWSRALTSDAADVTLAETEDINRSTVEHDYSVTVQVTMRALEATAGQRLNFHAGAVADEAGRALAIVGASGSGKTTAIRSLATRLGYLSDETVSVGDDLSILSHPKPLSVIVDATQPGAKASISPDEAGLRPTPEQASLQRIVVLRRGDGTHGLTPLSTPAAIVELVPQTSSLTKLENPLLRLSRTIEKCGGVFALHYEEASEHLDDLVDLLASPLGETPAPIHHPSTELGEPPPGEWSRAPWLDAVEYADGLVVMVESTANLLDGLGTTLWLALAQPATTAGLLATAEAAHGSHPDAASLVDDALRDLQANGLILPPA